MIIFIFKALNELVFKIGSILNANEMNIKLYSDKLCSLKII